MIGRFILVIYIMSLLQMWADSRMRVNADVCEIEDTFFYIIPNIPRIMGSSFSAHAADL